MIGKLGIFVLSLSAYVVSGYIGGLLSVPPAFASAVWPASGIALALALRFPFWPSVAGSALGAWLINLSLATDGFYTITAERLIIAFAVGIAAVMQLSAGFWLFKRFVGSFVDFASPVRILRFVLLVALVGCLVSCSISTAALWLTGAIPQSLAGFTWFTWWIGDSLGVLFFTPFILTLLSPKKALDHLQKAQIILPTLVIFLCTYVVFASSIERQAHEEVLQAEHRAESIAQKIRDRLRVTEHLLTAYDAFINTVPNYNQEQFNHFSKIMMRNESALHGVGWTRIIEDSERVAVEAHYRQTGYPEFTFTELTGTGELISATQKERYYPVLFIYPFTSNKAAFGLNLGANPARLAALEQALASGLPVATAPIVLAQETQNQKATILYRPIFSDGGGEFLGYVSGVLRIAGILGDTLGLIEETGFKLQVTDITDSETPQLLFESVAGRQKMVGIPTFYYVAHFGQRDYQLALTVINPELATVKDWVSWLVLTGGFLIAALIQIFILAITGSNTHIREEVTRKTHDLNVQKKLAQAASKAKSEFLSNMSHELRTPLNAISGLVHLCLKTELSPKQADYLNKVSLASSTLLSLINQTLDHAKIEAGFMSIVSERFSLTKVLKKLDAVFQLTAEQKNLKLTIEAVGDVPDAVVGDELRLEQILINLMGNALKFTERGEVSVRVSHLDNGQLQFDVCDTGSGIRKDYQDKLFVAFSQSDSSNSRNHGGTGLGLAISKQLSELMGGTLQLHSSSSDGSCFRLTLPLKVCDGGGCVPRPLITDTTSSEGLEKPGQADKTASASAEKLSTSPSSPNQFAESQPSIKQPATNQRLVSKPKPNGVLSGVTVLVAEDMALNQMVAKELLNDFGAQVILANNGAEALEKLAQHPEVAIVLMDIQMPVMDGYQATARIRSAVEFADMPVLAMTANALDEDIDRCLSAGMNGHIAKPIDPEQLVEKILQYRRLV